MDNEPPESGSSEALLRQLDLEAGEGDYKRVLLLRFLQDQARINQKLEAVRADEERWPSDDGDALVALRELDIEDAKSLNAKQLHQLRLDRDPAYAPAAEGAKYPLRALEVRPKSCARLATSPRGGGAARDERRACSSGDLDRREEVVLTEQIRGAGREERRLKSLDARRLQLTEIHRSYSRKLRAEVAAGPLSCATAAGPTLVKLPALFKHPGGCKFEQSAARYAAVNNV